MRLANVALLQASRALAVGTAEHGRMASDFTASGEETAACKTAAAANGALSQGILRVFCR
jgi:hypothetical protein